MEAFLVKGKEGHPSQLEREGMTITCPIKQPLVSPKQMGGINIIFHPCQSNCFDWEERITEDGLIVRCARSGAFCKIKEKEESKDKPTLKLK
jgi:hypothetical protein